MDERWEIHQSDRGWSVYRNHRIMRYDCFDEDEAMREVKRRVDTSTRVTIYDIDDNRSVRHTK